MMHAGQILGPPQAASRNSSRYCALTAAASSGVTAPQDPQQVMGVRTHSLLSVHAVQASGVDPDSPPSPLPDSPPLLAPPLPPSSGESPPPAPPSSPLAPPVSLPDPPELAPACCCPLLDPPEALPAVSELEPADPPDVPAPPEFPPPEFPVLPPVPDESEALPQPMATANTNTDPRVVAPRKRDEPKIIPPFYPFPTTAARSRAQGAGLLTLKVILKELFCRRI